VALCAKLQWPGADTLIGGSIKHGMVWVFPPAAEADAGPTDDRPCGDCGAVYPEPHAADCQNNDAEPDTSRPHVPGCPRLFLASAECLCNPARTALRKDLW